MPNVQYPLFIHEFEQLWGCSNLEMKVNSFSFLWRIG
jgi:hypothetical protein